MAKKTNGSNTILQVVAVAGMVVGAVTIAKAVQVRFKRKQDEAEIEEMVVAAENFSGAGGKDMSKWVNRPIIPTYRGMRRWNRGGNSIGRYSKWCFERTGTGNDLRAVNCKQGDELGTVY
jgi:hypothetical protein